MVLYPCGEKRLPLIGNRFRKAICNYPIKIIHNNITNELKITVSIGASFNDKPSATIDIAAILRKADECLYITKNIWE